MNIDDLTIGQAKELASMFGASATVTPTHPFVGKYVIARCYAAGVHAGEVVSVDGENVILKDSRRLWSWKAAEGRALSGVAQHGITSESKLDVLNPIIYLTGVCELIPVSVGVREQIHAYK
ncbi:MAG: hypothetical protein KGQ57_10670 [Burkholderiales bacterium]|nr:hypothetical protein [Burkholderiales bacterium]